MQVFGSFAVLAISLVSLAACGKPTEVELRLYPCMVAESGPPRRVDLEIYGYDEAGEAMSPLMRGFAIPEPSVLADGYATVGLSKPDGMVEAAFTLTWSYGPDVMARVMLPRRPVPAAGDVLELGADGCAPVGDTTGTSTGDSDGSSSGGGSTSTGDTSSSGSSGSSGNSSGEGTSTSTGDTSTGDTSTSTGSESSGSSSSTGESTMEGEDCLIKGEYFCENGGPGQLGNALFCGDKMKWAVADLTLACKPLAAFCPVADLTNPTPVGCVNVGVDDFSCACRDEPATKCQQADAKCLGNNKITLCTDQGDGDILVKGLCIGLCQEGGQGPYCEPQ